MNILFIEKTLRTDKLGIMYISAMLIQAGHNVYLIQDDIDPAEKYMIKNKIDVVCWSMMTSDAPWMFQKNKELKEKFKFISIVGGPHPTFFPQEAVNDVNIDYVVIGPGELVINDIIDGKINHKLIKGNIPDVDKLPQPYRNIQYRYDEFGKSRIKRFICGRYCYYSCNYCFNDKIKTIFKDQIKSMWKRKSVALTMKEIDDVKEKYGLEHANFNDDNIAANKEWLIEFCHEMKKRKLEWSGLICANSVDLSLLKLMKESGCVFLFIGIEAININTRKIINRKWTKIEELELAIRWSKEVGIYVRSANIIGFPVEDPLSDAFETLKFNQDTQPEDSIASIFQPFKGTAIWDYCYKNGYIDENSNGGTYYNGTKLKIKDADKINNLFHWWNYAVQYKLPLDFIKILIDVPLSDDIKMKLQDYKWETNRKLFYKL